MAGEIYYLSSLDSRRFAPVRECRVVGALVFDTGKEALVAKVQPPVIGQDFNRPDDIDSVILAARHEGASLDPVSEFPCFVFITISAQGYALSSPIRADDLTIIGWGELYRTYHDAENHVFR